MIPDRIPPKHRAIAIAATIAILVAIWWFWPTQSRPQSVRIAAAGNIACSSSDPRFMDGLGTGDSNAPGWCEQAAVSDVAAAAGVDAVLGLGDYQYEEAKSSDYETVYDTTWGRLRSITRPAIGNQEYKVHEANTFRSYFGDLAGPEEGWYSYDLGAWHVIVLNSNCVIAGGCDVDSPQVSWLEADLADHANSCMIAYWHHPRWSTGLYGSDRRVDTLWHTVAEAGVDVVLAAHEHDYERFEPLDSNGRSRIDGTRSFVVGTGGQAVYGPDQTAGGGDLAGTRRSLTAAASEIRIDDQHGVLLMTLDPTSYTWKFVGVDGDVLDQGSSSCTSTTTR